MTTPHAILEHTFGYSSFRGTQEAVINHLIAGDDVLVLMPTGGGKSLCYQIPALARPGTGVVISPLIALMQDQVSALHELGVRAGFLNSTLSPQEAWQTERALQRGELDLLYVAPERLLQDRMLDLLDNSQISLFAIDEAHARGLELHAWFNPFRAGFVAAVVVVIVVSDPWCAELAVVWSLPDPGVRIARNVCQEIGNFR